MHPVAYTATDPQAASPYLPSGPHAEKLSARLPSHTNMHFHLRESSAQNCPLGRCSHHKLNAWQTLPKEAVTSLAELGVPSARVKAEEKPDSGEEEDKMDEFLAPKRRGAAVKKGSECPYLDTISRQVGRTLLFMLFWKPWEKQC